MNALLAGAGQRMRTFRRRPPPGRMADLLVRLGPTFVKIGQYLALRPDLIGQEYCDEFARLLDEAPAGLFEDARQTLLEDLGGVPERLFAWLNPRPIGAASLAEVYQARTHAGEQVVVKIQRRGIRRRVEQDLKRAPVIGRILEHSGLVPGVSTREVVAELKTWMAEELDFGRERTNLQRLERYAERSRVMRVPHAYPAMCGPRVLTMEYLEGVPFTELLRLRRGGMSERIAELELDADRLAENLFEAVLEQIFAFELFHADTHPGNLLALPDNRVGFVDFGLVEPLDASAKDDLMVIVRAAHVGDANEMLRGLTAVLIQGPNADMQAFRADFLEEARAWQRAQLGLGSESSGETTPSSRFMVRALRAAGRHGLRLPPSLLAVYRSLLTAETVAHQVADHADLGRVAVRFFARLESDRLREQLEPEQVQALLVETTELLRTGPGRLERLLASLADDRFTLRVETTEARQDRKRADQRAELIGLAVVSVGLALLELAFRQDVLFDRVPVGSIVLIGLLVIYARCAVVWLRLR